MIDFNKIIDQHLERERRPKEIGKYYPSEIGRCMRKVWYSYLYPQQLDPEVTKIFEAGNIIHDFVVEVLRGGKNRDIELVKSEMPVKIETENFTISGRVDDLILLKSEGKLFLVEVKSTKNINFVPIEMNEREILLRASRALEEGVVKRFFYKTGEQCKSVETAYEEISDELLLPPENAAAVVKAVIKRIIESGGKLYRQRSYLPRNCF